MKTLNSNTKLVLAFFAGIMFLFLVNVVGRNHNVHGRFNQEKFQEMNFNHESRQNFRPDNRHMKGRFEKNGKFNSRDSIRSHNRLSYERPINRIPIMLEEVIITAPKISYQSNIIGDMDIFS